MGKVKSLCKVRFITDDHDIMPDWYPPNGTVGEVVEISDEGVWVDWPEGSTDMRGPWFCRLEDVEVIGGKLC